jgi:hypothetical protein
MTGVYAGCVTIFCTEMGGLGNDSKVPVHLKDFLGRSSPFHTIQIEAIFNHVDLTNQQTQAPGSAQTVVCLRLEAWWGWNLTSCKWKWSKVVESLNLQHYSCSKVVQQGVVEEEERNHSWTELALMVAAAVLLRLGHPTAMLHKTGHHSTVGSKGPCMQRNHHMRHIDPRPDFAGNTRTMQRKCCSPSFENWDRLKSG